MDIVEQAVQLKSEMESMKAKKRRLGEETEALEERLCRASSELVAAEELKEQIEELETVKQKMTDENAMIEDRLNSANLELTKVQSNVDKMMSALPAADGDEVISLDVGGQRFKAYRSTFNQFPQSVLATMVSSRWSDGARQEDGALFFDMDPSAFGEIMKYLRELRISATASPKFGRAAHDLALYLGILEPVSFKFVAPVGPACKDNRVTIFDGGATCEIQNTSITRSGGSSCILVVATSKFPITRIGVDRTIFSWSFECSSLWYWGIGCVLGLVDAGSTGTNGAPGHAEREMIGLETCTGSVRCLHERRESRLDPICEGDIVSFCVDMTAGLVSLSVNGRREVQLVDDRKLVSVRDWRPAVFARGRPSHGSLRIRIIGGEPPSSAVQSTFAAM